MKMEIRVFYFTAALILSLRKMLLAVDHESTFEITSGRRGVHRVSGLVELRPAWPLPLGRFYFLRIFLWAKVFHLGWTELISKIYAGCVLFLIHLFHCWAAHALGP
jgi:hypothetical protein